MCSHAGSYRMRSGITRCLDLLDIQPGPGDLVILNTLKEHSARHELLSIDLCSVVVQLSPDGVSVCYLVEDVYLYIGNRREEECPVLTHAFRASKVSLRMKRLLTAIAGSKPGNQRLQIVTIHVLNHSLKDFFGG